MLPPLALRSLAILGVAFGLRLLSLRIALLPNLVFLNVRLRSHNERLLNVRENYSFLFDNHLLEIKIGRLYLGVVPCDTQFRSLFDEFNPTTLIDGDLFDMV